MRPHPTEQHFTLARYAERLCDVESAVTGALGVSEAAYREAVQAPWWPDPPRDHYGARPELALLIRAVVRLTRPATAVETGVAQGLTTAVILQAMAENGGGRLYSVDVPPPVADDGYVGSLVPLRLRSRWTLRTGLSRDELAPLLAELGTIDLFLHDAEHRYESQMEEYEQAWPRLRAGGQLVTDDVDTPAFMDFAARVGGTPFLIGEVSSKSGVGLMRKPKGSP
jgi:predicted O-methyltransferase YrrM